MAPFGADAPYGAICALWGLGAIWRLVGHMRAMVPFALYGGPMAP